MVSQTQTVICLVKGSKWVRVFVAAPFHRMALAELFAFDPR